MAKNKTVHRCTECGTAHPRWAGQCLTCGAWNCIVEELDVAVAAGPRSYLVTGSSAQPLNSVDLTLAQPLPSGIAELDRVLGGGFVPGSVTLVGGEPGVGKSTLLLQLAGQTRGVTLYVSAEESAQQVRLRAERLRCVTPNVWLLAETSVPAILRAVDTVKPDLLIVDSIQTVSDPDLGSAPGSVVQVRECAHRFVAEAKQRCLTTVLVGHVTKEGGLAGPRVLEHVVDTVLAFDGDNHHALRLLRAVKHRFGSTNELGLFDMTPEGLISVSDPSSVFLADRRSGVSGSVVVPTIEGQRPLLVEVQALVVGSPLPQPRRSAQGVDVNRLNLLLAVVERRAGRGFAKHDVYLSALGGVRLHDPGADLGICAAAVSALTDRPVPEGVICVGEVGLGGELRQVPHTARRLAEAARLGFDRAIVPPSAPVVKGIRNDRIETVGEALTRLLKPVALAQTA